MKASQKTWFVIVNPASGSGSARKSWPKIKHALERHGFNFEHTFTDYPKHSVELVENALKSNFKNFICVGGDGTLHNIVNGIFSQNMIPPQQVKVGIIPFGTGNDWIKTHHIPKNIESAIKLIKSGYVVQQDLGKIDFLDADKPPVFFNNFAGVGFDGYVVSKVEKFKKIGALSYLIGALIGVFSFKPFKSKIYVNSQEISGDTFMVSIGICRFSGGGMQLTNTPNPFDGLFDISIAKHFKFLDIIKNIPNLFNGKIATIKKVNSLKANNIKIHIYQKTIPFIQADGELIGSGDIEMSIIPKAFSFFVLKP
ncbi:MAG: diacylglycerol/lipid kinase family protein [Tamlana sp.]